VAPSPAVATSGSPVPEFVIRDGEPWILYQWVTDPPGNGLFLVRPDGTDKHRILTGLPAQLAHPDWSPDGRQLAFDIGVGGDVVEVWTAAADGSNAKKAIGCVQAPCLQVAYPAWSPDGSELAYVRIDHSDATGSSGDRLWIEVLDRATGARRVVARTPPVGAEYVEYLAPRWSPDGTQIVFSVVYTALPLSDDQPSTGSVIAVAKADGSEVDSPRMLTDRNLFGAHPDWSPDGQLIVFNQYHLGYHQTSTDATNLYTIHPDGTALNQVTHFGANDTRATGPTWTPDGTRIIFTHITRDSSADAYGLRFVAFIDPDGSNLAVLDSVLGVGPRLRPIP
jgi:Tol biopolymer transport system component